MRAGTNTSNRSSSHFVTEAPVAWREFLTCTCLPLFLGASDLALGRRYGRAECQLSRRRVAGMEKIEWISSARSGLLPLRFNSHGSGRSQAATDYLITSSACNSSVCGIVSPSALADFILITISNLVGCSTGRSPGLAPFRILST